MKRPSILSLFIFFSIHFSLFSQNSLHPTSDAYVYPEDPKVLEKLETWRDQKFGILIHWGLYAVPGIIESWSICNEDWITRDTNSRYDDYKKWYWNLASEFNPQAFDPDQWAQAAAKAGMKYMVFTTKHHDGFAMFDTQQSDFSIARGPFASHPKANVAHHVFEAFRKKNMMIGAYFSKPDWHSPYFWWDLYATPDRNVNYDIRKHPWRWNQFIQFTHNQIHELTHDYGDLDILWLDGGWVRPRETVTQEVINWGAPIPPFSQEINMPKLAEIAREKQPGLLIVDRTVHGPFENYRTPEQSIPATMSHDPWESCITLGGAWGYVPNDQFKSAEKVIHQLCEVVAKGGNLLLGVGPTAQGLFLPAQIQRLEEIGRWLEVNGKGIYETRALSEFQDGAAYFTESKDHKTRFALYLLDEKNRHLPIQWGKHLPKSNTKIYLQGYAKPIPWFLDQNKVQVRLPKDIRLSDQPALVFSFTPTLETK